MQKTSSYGIALSLSHWVSCDGLVCSDEEFDLVNFSIQAKCLSLSTNCPFHSFIGLVRVIALFSLERHR